MSIPVIHLGPGRISRVPKTCFRPIFACVAAAVAIFAAGMIPCLCFPVKGASDLRPAPLQGCIPDPSIGLCREVKADAAKSNPQDGKLREASADKVARTARNHILTGYEALEAGSLSRAAKKFELARDLADSIAQDEVSALALVGTARTFRAIGDNARANATLRLAHRKAEKAASDTALAQTFWGLGEMALYSRGYNESHVLFDNAMARAVSAGDRVMASRINISLGNLFTREGRHDKASVHYAAAVDETASSGEMGLLVIAATNCGRSLARLGDLAGATRLFSAAGKTVESLEPFKEVPALVSLASSMRDAALLSATDPESRALWSGSYELFKKASSLAKARNYRRLEAIALLSLSAFHEEAGDFHEALAIARRSVFASQEALAQDVLYRGLWACARCLKANGDIEEAITAFREAISALNPIRRDVLASRGAGPESATMFRTEVGPVYFGLADLLIARSRQIGDPDAAGDMLKEARGTLEAMKTAEMQDYFGDDCDIALRAKARSLDEVSPETGIIYIVPLQDRTELLLSHTGGMTAVAVPIGSDGLESLVLAFRESLVRRGSRGYLNRGRELYEAVVSPVIQAIESAGLKNLVFVPDGSLRNVPMAALHDGASFLVEKYPVAVAPALDLTDPRPGTGEAPRIMAAGLTRSVEGYPPLPHVRDEISELRLGQGATVLMDDTFTADSFRGTLAAREYSAVHLATHGEFTGTSDDSFVLAWDGRITMDTLAGIMGTTRYRDKPVELLFMSACKTAAGDDRAGLGLAGVAVKAGARSAVATLWYVDDRAASVLVREFYRSLCSGGGASKAVALQKAQISLIKNPELYHPVYWAPFILIGNWQ